MRPGIACAVVFMALAWAGAASAEYLCVPNTTIPGCPASGSASESTIGDAVTNGVSGDTILIGAGTFSESVDDGGTAYHFVGAGPTRTIVQGAGSPAMNISSGSTVTNLGINLYNAPGETGLMLAGTATNVAVTATQPMSATNPIGVDLTGGTFARGSVVLPLAGSEVDNYAGVIGSGTLSDSSVTAPVGIADAGGTTPGIPAVHRTRILANQGVLVGSNDFKIDDSLIVTRAGAKPETGISLSDLDFFGSFTLRHVNLIGSGGSGSTGVSAVSNGLIGPAVTTVLLESSIVRGYATSISAVANGTGVSAHTTVTLQHTYYDSAHTSTIQVAGGVANIVPDSHSGNVDPRFVNSTAGDFHLQAGSPAIDGGAPTLAGGESTTDLDGHPRQIAGHKGDAAVTDIGAFEFTPHLPVLRASASASRVPGGKRITFSASGSDPSPGDSVSFLWRFDDGGTASGATVSHAFVKAGHHTATVTIADLDGFTAVARVTITVTGPSISKLSIKPKRLRAGDRATISYRDSQAAKTTFKLFRMGSRHAIRMFSHRDRAGKNHLRFKARRLARGRYRLLAVPRNKAGAGTAVAVRFRIVA
jgi:hypothetical protein